MAKMRSRAPQRLEPAPYCTAIKSAVPSWRGSTATSYIACADREANENPLPPAMRRMPTIVRPRCSSSASETHGLAANDCSTKRRYPDALPVEFRGRYERGGATRPSPSRRAGAPRPFRLFGGSPPGPCPRQIFRREIPVHQMVDEGIDEVRAPVLIVEVIGVLPHVVGQKRLGPLY